MEPISATLITFNEERNIEEALRSLDWASEVVVVDCGSSDRTIEICRRHTDKVFCRQWTGFVDQKNFAVEKAAYDWIFSLDADERVSPGLRLEIGQSRVSGLASPGYRIPRVAFFMGRWIRHGDWYPDYQLRLFDRRHGRWQGGHLHESVRTDAPPSRLKGEIFHYTYRSLSDYLKRLEIYSRLAAADYDRRGKKSDALRMLANPAVTFLRAYIMKLGFLDGVPGLMAAVMGAVSVFFKYATLYELRTSKTRRLEDSKQV